MVVVIRNSPYAGHVISNTVEFNLLKDMTPDDKPLVGISACLLGEAVRYDGSSKLDHYLRDVLGNCVEFVPVCPEAESGMGVPREAMRLVKTGKTVRLITTNTEVDQTAKLTGWMHGKLSALNNLPLCGYVLKARSPSCGPGKVRVYNRDGGTGKNGTGLFARGLTEQFPFLPVEDEGSLNDSPRRENFIERIFAMHRWHVNDNGRRSLKKLMEFHARHKYQLMAHCPKTLTMLGTFLAGSRQSPINKTYNKYFENFITALSKRATVRKNTNVLQHIMGYFKKEMSGDEKAELAAIIKSYNNDQLPLIIPITLLNLYVRKYNSPYLEQQYYLNPHPLELKLRNHA